jgi:alpha-mannosidase
VLAGGQVDGRDLGIRDQGGDERFLQRFALWTADRHDPVDAMRGALEHQNPLILLPATGSSGPLPAEDFSMLDLDDRNVLLWALKPGEDDPAHTIVGRAWNLAERQADTTMRIRPPWTVREAILTTHIETPIIDEPVSGGGEGSGGVMRNAAALAKEGRVSLSLPPRSLETWRMRVDRVGAEDPERALFLPGLGMDVP